MIETWQVKGSRVVCRRGERWREMPSPGARRSRLFGGRRVNEGSGGQGAVAQLLGMQVEGSGGVAGSAHLEFDRRLPCGFNFIFF